jgi:oxygen-independent coproporphyrinogen-3 oxidase
MNALRLDAGFTVAGFREATGLPFGAAAAALSASIARGLLEIDQDVIRATPRGRRYLDELLQYWIAEEPRDARIG